MVLKEKSCGIAATPHSETLPDFSLLQAVENNGIVCGGAPGIAAAFSLFVFEDARIRPYGSPFEIEKNRKHIAMCMAEQIVRTQRSSIKDQSEWPLLEYPISGKVLASPIVHLYLWNSVRASIHS
jgi:hypothetical protein